MQHALWSIAFAALAVCATAGAEALGQDDGHPVIPVGALAATAVGGLERTHATATVVPVSGQPFASALRVTIGTNAPESNATQLTIRNSGAVKKGDALLATLSVRGASSSGRAPGQIMLLFERATDPWTKSATQSISTAKRAETWKRLLIPFTAAEDYAPGEAMVSLRFAFGPQVVEVGGLSVVDYGRSKSAEELQTLAAVRNPLGAVTVTVESREPLQTMLGLGGNFCQPRYGATVPMDPVGRYNLANLHVAHARIGIPLNSWTPERAVYRDEGPAHAALLQMQEMARHKIPIVGSVWEGPQWMLGGRPDQSGRTLPSSRYGDCLEAIAQFLVAARDKYGATVDNCSFNEPDYGVNFRFTPAEMAEFIRQAGPRFKALSLTTKFLVGDTANANNFVDYARPLLRDKEIQPYLGPLAFHCWDALTTPDARYAEIAALGRETGKPVWCTEAGHDAGLWRTPNPWPTWDNALRTALAYEKTVRLTGASLMDYWTYQNNYAIVQPDGTRPYPVFFVIRQLEEVLAPRSRVVVTVCDSEELHPVATVGPRAGQFAVLLVSPSGAGSVTLAGLPADAAVTVEERDAVGAKTRAGRVDGAGRLVVAVPARSVVSVHGR